MKVFIRKRLNPIESLWLFFLIIIIFLNSLVDNIPGIISYGTYIAITVIFTCMFLKGRLAMRGKWSIFVLIIMMLGIVSSLLGEKYFYGVTKDLHMQLFFCIFVLTTVCIKWNKYISLDFGHIVMRTLLIIGIFASIYSLIFQGNNILDILIKNDYHAYESYKSFFSQRNVFASFLLYACMASLYFSKNNKKYLIFILIFGIEIFLTNSRMALFSLSIMLCLYLYFNSCNRWSGALIALIIVIPCFYYVIIPLILNRFIHVTHLGVSSDEMRVAQLTMGLNKIIGDKKLLLGYGMGSGSLFLKKHFNYGSFHNEYMDILFQGGIVTLTFYIATWIFCCKKILLMKNDKLKWPLLSTACVHVIYALVESDNTLFYNTYFSYLATLIFCVLPQCADKKDSINKKNGY